MIGLAVIPVIPVVDVWGAIRIGPDLQTAVGAHPIAVDVVAPAVAGPVTAMAVRNGMSSEAVVQSGPSTAAVQGADRIVRVGIWAVTTSPKASKPRRRPLRPAPVKSAGRGARNAVSPQSLMPPHRYGASNPPTSKARDRPCRHRVARRRHCLEVILVASVVPDRSGPLNPTALPGAVLIMTPHAQPARSHRRRNREAALAVASGALASQVVASNSRKKKISL